MSRRGLLFLAAAVWVAAGVNVLRLGVLSWYSGRVALYFLAPAAGVFLLFGAMFLRMVLRNMRRIVGFGTGRHPFWRFFPLRSYIIIVVMMTGGILLRRFGILPQTVIAFFYSGLGSALALAGVLYAVGAFWFDRLERRFLPKTPAEEMPESNTGVL